jgi:hypothetical protein
MTSGIMKGTFLHDDSVRTGLAFSRDIIDSCQGSNCDLPVASAIQWRSNSTCNLLFDAAIIKVIDDLGQILPVFPK